jgi:LPXTG-motif cell wall-anchored protein
LLIQVGHPGAETVATGLSEQGVKMRKALTALALAAAFAVFVGPAALAQEYPPSGENLTVSDSRVVRGQSITISGGGAEPGATVEILIAGQVVATTTADEDGNFSATFTIPAGLEVGTYTITAVSNGVVLSTLEVVVTGSGSTTSGDLPFTGSSTLPGIGIGIGLIALGSSLLLLSRRRRNQREHETVA